MKYFLNTEFLEGTQKKLFGETKPTIDLISIGIVCEDGREYYAISKDFNLKEAWNRYDIKTSHNLFGGQDYKVYWIRDNVLKPIWEELHLKDLGISHKAKDILQEQMNKLFTYSNFKRLVNKYGKTNKQIAKEIKHFVANRPIENNKEQWILDYDTKGVQFYGYYADYDWVVFCWLFGKMIDLPKGFPMYCVDLKQTLDEKAWSIYCNNGTLNSETSLEERIKYLKGESINHLIETNKPKFPKQTNEHNALADARWTYELYKFLNTI